MNKHEYEQYLRSPGWRVRRAAALKRCGGRCEDCAREREWAGGSGSGHLVWPAVEIHHLTYERVGNELPDDLVALCERHHRARHGMGDRRIDEAQRQIDAAPEWEPDMSAEPTIAEHLGVKAREIR